MDPEVTIRAGRGGSRDGAVLAVVVLLALAVLGLAHTLLISAEAAHAGSRAHARWLQLDAAATGAVIDEMASGWRSWMDTVAVGDARAWSEISTGGLTIGREWRRLHPEVWTVEGSASRTSESPVAARRLVWIYDAATRVHALPAVLALGPAALADLQGTVVPDGIPSVGLLDSPGLGHLTLDRLVRVADTLPPVGTPVPTESGGSCLTDGVWSWGDPLRHAHPCADHFALRGRSSALTLNGGAGQGVLVVDGDLTLRGGVVFHGIVLAAGEVSLVEGSTVEGRVVAFGGARIDGSSRIVGSEARAREVLDALRPALGLALLLHPARRLGPG